MGKNYLIQLLVLCTISAQHCQHCITNRIDASHGPGERSASDLINLANIESATLFLDKWFCYWCLGSEVADIDIIVLTSH